MTTHRSRASPVALFLIARLLVALLLALLPTPTLAQPAPTLAQPALPQALGIVDPPALALDTPAAVDRRLALYRQAGYTLVRAPVSWSDEQFPDGHWRPPTFLPYARRAVAAGFRLEIDLATLSAPPAWFIAAHPDARLVDQYGQVTTTVTLSYWFPSLRALVHDKTAHLLAGLAAEGLLAQADAVLPSLGPADEPIYPAQWVLPTPSRPPGFWWFDVHAQADYRRHMQAQYASLAALDAAWHATYTDWAQLTPPRPGQASPQQWADTLLWYRDAKRDFVAWQVADTRAQLAQYAPSGQVPVLKIIVPGEHIPPASWQAALRGGDAGDQAVVLMVDTDFLLDLARRTGSALHFTGMPAGAELEYIQARLRAAGGGVPLTAETVGTPDGVAHPQELADEILANRLRGFDLVNAAPLFAPDGTPTPLLAATAAANARILHGWADPAAPLTLGPGFTLVQEGCVGPDSARLCLADDGRLTLAAGQATLWSAGMPRACGMGQPWVAACHLVFQADGNLVLYDGPTPYWNTATAASPVRAIALQLSGSAASLSLVDAAGQSVWSNKTGRAGAK